MNRVYISLRKGSLVVALVGILLLGLALSGTARAGKGECEETKFALVVSARHDADPDRLDEWHTAFQQASELLYDATDGQHQFGKIFVCNKSYAGRTADAHLFDEDGRSYVNLPIPGLGAPGAHMFLYGDERYKPFVIVHEFGHYGYGLYDEYAGPGGGAECVENPVNADASIMEGGWWQAPGVDGGDGYLREISEFCVASNHDPDGDTEQENQYHKSCWETMVDYYPDLLLPAELPEPGPTAGADDIVWIVLEPETRLVLCIDRSGSMNEPPWKMEYAKLGAQMLIDLMEIGDKVGVVSYATDVSVDFPLTEVVSEATREGAKDAIEGLTAGGWTRMGSGLWKSLKQITSPGDTACQQAIVLLSNGFENAGTHPYDVLPHIKEEMTRVFTVGVGDDINEEVLETIASETGGKYFPVESAEDLLVAFGVLSMEIKDGGLVVNEELLIGQNERVVRHVPIDNTDEGSVFEITWGGSDLDLTLERPDGSVIDPAVAAADPDIEYVAASTYEFYRLASVEQGEWVMVAEGVDVSGEIEFTVQVLVKNKTIFFDVFTDKDEYEYPEEVHVQAQTLFGVPLTGVDVSGVVVRPDGSEVPISLYDDGLSAHGDEFADDGMYSNVFWNYSESGSYSFELVVENSDGSKRVDGGEFLRPDSLGGPDLDSLPTPGDFTRWASKTVLVSDVSLSYDVLINPSDIFFYKTPTPSPKHTFFAVVRCDEASTRVGSVKVRFYDGDPDFGGSQIGDDQWAQNLSPGNPDTVMVSWYCADEFRHRIYVVVDPDGELPEYNEENNKAYRHFSPMVPERGLMSADVEDATYRFALGQNHPNPFTSVTAISYTIPEFMYVTLKVYDSAGRVVKTLVAEEKGPGYFSTSWDGRDEFGESVVSGVYFCKLSGHRRSETHTGLTNQGFAAVKKMTLLR